MKKNVLLACAGMACCTVALAAPPGPVQSATGVKVDPISLATIRRIDGRLVRTSDWVPYTGSGARETGTLVFDSFQAGEAHEPVGGPECGIGEGSRWFFGTGFYAPFVAEDMTYTGGGETVNEYTLGWYYGVDTPIDTNFIIAFFAYEEQIDNTDCASSSTGVFPDDFTPTSDGIAANFGELPTGGGFYYYSNIDALNDLGMLMPGDGVGTYESIQLWQDAISEEFFVCPGPCQNMWYGCSNNGGLPGRPGTQDIQAYLDDGGGVGTPDGLYDPATECYDMSLGVCPEPVGAAGSFWVKDGGGGCTGSADHDGDGFITGIDFDLFVADFEFGCLDNTPPCTNSADHDGDGFITGIDYDLFVADFEAGCL